MLKGHVHDSGKRHQPGAAIVDHENAGPPGLEHAMALPDEGGGMGGVLDDAVGVDQVESRLAERQSLPVTNEQVVWPQIVVDEVLARKADGGGRQVDAGCPGPSTREADEIRADPASDLKQPLLRETIEVDQPGKVAELIKSVLVQVIEERPRANWVVGHVHVVDAGVPVASDLLGHSPLS